MKPELKSLLLLASVYLFAIACSTSGKIRPDNPEPDVPGTPSGQELSIDVPEVVLEASGKTYGTILVSSPVDFTVSCTAVWLKITQTSGRADGNIVKAGENIEFYLKPQSNFEGGERLAQLMFTPDGLAQKSLPVKQTGENFLSGTKGLPAVWLLNDTNVENMRATFVTSGYVKASRGSAAVLYIHRNEDNQNKETLGFNVANDGALEMRMLGEGDWIQYNVPVDKLEKGTAVHITASYHSDNSANKYFIFDWFDAGEWKTAPGLKKSDSGIEYHYESNGLGLSQAYSPNIDQTVILTQDIENDFLKMRLRCVGNKKYDESNLDFSSNALTRIAAAKTHGTSPIIRLLDGPRPEKKVRVLFIGNSYTYYNWSPYMLKEIAWKEGLEVEVALSAHSGFTIEKHLAHKVTQEKIAEGNYDYAIVQEYNDRLAVIGADLAAGTLGADATAYAEDIAEIMTAIRTQSPSVNALVEMSWGTKTGTGSLIKTDWTDYATMQAYVTAGAEYAAKNASASCTLLGQAWKKVIAQRPDIEMYHTDLHHPSYAGSYLKACVNYLTLSGKPFGPDPCDCLLDSATAAYLRSVAQEFVLGNSGN